MSELKSVLAREGRSARNLNNYIVPMKSQSRVDHEPKSYRNKNLSGKSNSSSRRRSQTPRLRATESPNLKSCLFTKPSDSTTSVSERARYWKLLFDNLQRAVDQIYVTCQEDKNTDECKESILILKNYKQEFESLSKWIKLEKDLEKEQERLENGDHYGDHDEKPKPIALAWEVRKTTPIRNNSGNSQGNSLNNSSLNVTSDENNNMVNSWADKVKSVGENSWILVGNKHKKAENSGLSPAEVKVCEKNNLTIQHSMNLESNYAPITEESSLETPKKNTRTEHFENSADFRAMNLELKIDLEESTGLNTYRCSESALTYRKTEVNEYTEVDTCRTYTPPGPLSPSQLSPSIIPSNIPSPSSPTQNSPTNLLDPAFQRPVDPIDHYCTPDASWAELNEIEEALRQPGGVAKIHEKLSSPSRRKVEDSEEARKRYEDRHAAAEKRREELEEKRKTKSKQAEEKIDKVLQFQISQKSERKQALEQKLAKAEQLKEDHINSVKHQAHDEGTAKIQEVGFINSITENMKRIEKEAKIKQQENQFNATMLERENEKARVNQEKVYREKSAVEKRNQLQKERLDWLTELADKRKDQEVRIQQERQDDLKEKEMLAQRKREAREEKLRELHELEEERNKKLREKIASKSATWEKRKNDVLKLKSQKAVEMALGNQLYCSVDNMQNCLPQQLTPPKLGSRAKSLPASPRVDGTRSSVNINKPQKHIRNLFKEHEGLNMPAITSKSLVNVDLKSSPTESDMPNFENTADSVLSHVSEEVSESLNTTLNETSENVVETAVNHNSEFSSHTNTNQIPHKRVEILSDPVSLYFMSEKSVENIQKMEEFERMLKKRLKKIKSRMNSRANKYEIEVGDTKQPPSANKNKINKALKEIEKVTQLHDPTQQAWPDQRVKQVDRSLRDLMKLLPVGDNEKTTFRIFKGFQILSKLLSLASTQRSLSSLSSTSLLGIRSESTNNQISPLPDRTLSNICKTIVTALTMKTSDNMENVNYVIHVSNRCLTPVIERLNHILRFEEMSMRLGSVQVSNSNMANSTFSASDDILSELMGVICTVLDKIRCSNSSTSDNTENNVVTENGQNSNIDAALDFISLIISVGTVDLIGEKLKRIRSSIDDAPDTCSFLINTASTISVICYLLKKFDGISSCNLVKQHFTQACEQNDFAAIIPVVYTVLVLSGSQLEPRPTIFDGSQFGDEEREMSLLKKDSMNFLPLNLAKVTYVSLQSVNACFGLSMNLERFAEPQMSIHLFRHIFNYLLWHLIRTDETNNILKYNDDGVSKSFNNSFKNSKTSKNKQNLQNLKSNTSQRFNELETDILLELMQLIGHFCIGSRERQDFLASGVQPTVLAQLCALPFSFFNEPKKRNVLLPTLFVICFENEENMRYLENLDMSRALLKEVIDNDEMKNSPIFASEDKNFWENVKLDGM